MIIDALQDYWIKSQRVHSLSSPQAKEIYILHHLRPLIDREKDSRRKALFERLTIA